jgi:arylsulfatase A-like enzyme
MCIEGHWGPKTGGCDYFHAGTKADPNTVMLDTTPMLKDGYGADDAELIMDHFEAFANKSVAAGKQFLAVVWFQNVHVQYTAVAKYTALYPVSANTTQAQQDFWGSLSAMDAQIGRCRAILRRLGVADNTLVWFTSDNGPEVGQPGTTRGLVGRKRDFTEGGIRMPSMLEWPAKINVNINSTFPAVSNDILPTVVEALGVKRGNDWTLDGISLMPLITNPKLKVRSTPIGHATGQPGDAFPAGFISNTTGVVGKPPPRALNDFDQHQFAWTDNDMKVWVHFESG